MLNIVIFGAPGSGKGTQSAFIEKKYNLVHLSTGDILRAEIAKGSEIGNKAKGLMDQGLFVPDEMIIAILAGAIDDNKAANGFIFDGFPRTTVQAEALDAMLKERGMSVDVMLNVDVPADELVKRLLERGKTSGRSDDNLETIQNRIKVYEEKTLPVLNYYKGQKKDNYIKGDGTMDEVFAAICAVIDAKA